MEQLKLPQVAEICGTVNMPGSKSLSNRALLLSALSRGTTVLRNLLVSDDVSRMLEALQKLGVRYELSANGTCCRLEGLGGAFNCSQLCELFLGNAGTAMRPLCAALSCSSGEFVLTGEPRMYERPIEHLTNALVQAGAQIEYLGTPGYPPLKITGKKLQGGEIHIDGSVSSQFLTALLMSAPLFGGETRIVVDGELVSKPYIDITLKMMQDFGVTAVNHNYQCFEIPASQTYVSPGDFLVEGDASGASYFLAAGAIRGSITVTGLGSDSIQGDIHFVDVLQSMGADVKISGDEIRVASAPLKGVDLDLNHIPDAAMTVAVLALFATGTTVIRNVYNWRVKETDRLSAMACELRKLGAEVEEGTDYISITPPPQLTGATIDTYNDHRMAMCFSLASLGTEVVINDPGCTRKTFPDYFRRFASVCRYQDK